MPDAKLSAGARQALLGIARKAIAHGLLGRRFKPDPPADPALVRPAGAFVTLLEGDALRGCIGTFEADRPLYRTVAEMARVAAFGDPRFPPVTARELDGLALEISVLGPRVRVTDPGEVQVGRHGIYLVHGPHRGVLLPQVAVDHGWDRERFLEETCRKAGTRPDAWRHGAEIHVFEAEVFGEDG